ncbi:MAG: inositol monophosphatase family protein [Balneolaceae bacterium]
MNRDLEVALKAARLGVSVIRSYMGTDFSITEKGKNDLVTEADIVTEKEIIRYLLSEFPDDRILAEETESSHSLSNKRMWIIDPIDGTTNFAYRFPIFCVSVGLWKNGKPDIAVVIEVNRNEEFTAVAGKGAFLNGKRITVSSRKDPSSALLGTGFPYNDMSLVDDYIRLFHELTKNVKGIRRPGAATYDLCCVADGRFDGFYEYALKAWDVGAAALIVQEAGGIVTDWEGGENWLFGQRIIAANPSIHRYLLKMIREFIG